jgi:hypothetical protein
MPQNIGRRGDRAEVVKRAIFATTNPLKSLAVRNIKSP